MKWRTYSVFVSSTFADMQAERDYLQTHVFPLINGELRRYCISLRIIDLRFGINTLEISEESVEEKVLRVCMDEINRSRPFFLGLLGNRYGTTPKESKLPRLAKQYKGQSITAIEIMHGFLQRDDIQGCLFMERDSACYEHIPLKVRREKYDDSCNPEKQQDWEKLQSLKQSIKKRLTEKQRSECFHEYIARWDGHGMTDLDDFGITVKEAILNEIHAHYTAEHNEEPFVDEQRTQEEFLHLHRERRYQRNNLFENVSRMILGGSMVAITGPEGSGKSSLYTALVDNFCQRDNVITLFHATDTGEENRNIDYMLARWIYQLELRLGVSHQNTSDAKARITYFRNLLRKVPEGLTIVLFIDGVEGFHQTLEGKYLTFYPKSIIANCCLCCTCLPDVADELLTYHHSLQRYDMPVLTRDEAEGIIHTYAEYEDKELYPQNVNTLLSKGTETLTCYESPLWLVIALQYVTRLNQRDFLDAVDRAEQYEKSFDKGLIASIDEKIKSFPYREEELFAAYLNRIGEAYGVLPTKVFQYLSASYNGLDECVLAELLGDVWDLRTFSIVRGFLRGFITEQGQMKTWQLVHRKVRIPLTAARKAALCGDIVGIYLHKLYANQLVTDNLFYYLFHCNDTLSAFHYIFSNKWYESRVKEELIGVSEVMGTDQILTFLFSTFNLRHKGVRKLMPAWMAMGRLRECITDLANAACKRGDYQKTVLLIDKFHAFLFDEHISYDNKLLNYMFTIVIKLDATEQIYTDSRQIDEYRCLIDRMKIRGPISLLLAPIAKWYYNWKITKIK